MMNISYWFSSPGGDVPVDSETFGRPFIVEPLQNHPFMALGDFFHLVTHFILGKAGPFITSVLSSLWGRDIALDDIDNIIMRYEKYGTLYQIVSAEVVSGSLKTKFAVSAAVTPAARESITTEYNLLSYIDMMTGLPYLPRTFCINSEDIEKNGEVDTIILTLAEWFEGYHEWHFSKDDAGRDQIVIWDTGRGNRPASDQEAYTIIEEASKILTLYYNVDTYERIIPWHHGAGDFVVKTGGGTVDVRLVTVRGYESIATPSNESIDPSRALLLFFLELVTKIRMDKSEGMGDTTWAGSIFAEAAVEGFVHAIKAKETQGRSGSLKVDNVVASLRALTQDEIQQIIGSRLDEYQARDASDYNVVKAHIKDQAGDIINALQHLPSLHH